MFFSFVLLNSVVEFKNEKMKNLNLRIGLIFIMALGFIACEKKGPSPKSAETPAIEQTETASANRLWQQNLPIQCFDDHFSGGGTIDLGTSNKGTFSVWGKADMSKCESWGHLEYSDNAGGPKVKALTATYYCCSSTGRIMTGDCEINGVAGFTYTVCVYDEGEPGVNDVFELTLSNGFSTSNILNSGNIQIH
jgi:hypothetical protein